MTSTWSYHFDLPDDGAGWVWAPEPDEDIAAWAQGVCASMDLDEGVEVELAAELRAYALSFRERGFDLGALWVPDPANGVLAALATEQLKSDPGQPLTLEVVESLERSLGEPERGEATLSRVDLPAGPAVRHRRIEASGGYGLKALAEYVSHVIVPGDLASDDGGQVAVRQLMTWRLLAEGEALAELADDAARLVEIVRG